MNGIQWYTGQERFRPNNLPFDELMSLPGSQEYVFVTRTRAATDVHILLMRGLTNY